MCVNVISVKKLFVLHSSFFSLWYVILEVILRPQYYPKHRKIESQQEIPLKGSTVVPMIQIQISMFVKTATTTLLLILPLVSILITELRSEMLPRLNHILGRPGALSRLGQGEARGHS